MHERAEKGDSARTCRTPPDTVVAAAFCWPRLAAGDYKRKQQDADVNEPVKRGRPGKAYFGADFMCICLWLQQRRGRGQEKGVVVRRGHREHAAGASRGKQGIR